VVKLTDRLALVNDLRYDWLQANDTYLLSELNRLFKHLYVRGAKIDAKDKHIKLVMDYFTRLPEVDYFIYSEAAPTHCDLKYVKQSRILFYRPSHSWSRGRDGRSHFRPVSCRYVRLKRQILTIFDEELIRA